MPMKLKISFNSQWDHFSIWEKMSLNIATSSLSNSGLSLYHHHSTLWMSIGIDEIPAKVLRFPVFERENGIFSSHAFPGKFPRKLLISRHFSHQFREFYALHFFLIFLSLNPKAKKKRCTERTFS